MNAFKFSFVFFFSFITFFYAKSQISKDSAVNIVLTRVLLGDSSHVDLIGSKLAQYGPSGLALPFNDVIEFPYDTNWVFFIDDKPKTNWHHSCRYVFVDANSGDFSIVANKSILPKYWLTDFDTISQIQLIPQLQLQPALNPPMVNAALNEHLYAVIIAGDVNLGAGGERFWRDVSMLYTTLKQVYGYTDANIIVHYYDGSSGSTKYNNQFDQLGYNEIDYPAYKESIHSTFTSLAVGGSRELNSDDQLFVFTDDHGAWDPIANQSYAILPTNASNPDEHLWASDLASWSQNIKCSQMIFLLQQCFSGGFTVPLMSSSNALCKNRTVNTSCSNSEESFSELKITKAKYTEFTYYWVSAMRGWFPKIDDPWEPHLPVFPFPQDFFQFFGSCGHPDDNPDVNGDNVVQMQEAFNWANKYDTWSHDSYWCPNFIADSETPVFSSDISFQEDLQALSGLTGTISNSQLLANRSYAVGGALTVSNNSTLTFPNWDPVSKTPNLHFISDTATLYVDAGSHLNFGNGMLCSGNDPNYININGTINALINVTFKNIDPLSTFYGLYLNNPSLETVMNGCQFINTGFGNWGHGLTISNSSFTNATAGVFESFSGNVNVSNCQFDKTSLYLGNYSYPFDPDVTAVVDNCTFSNAGNNDAISLNHYDNFSVQNNAISYANLIFSGIGLYYCGQGVSGNQNVFNNSVTDCGIGINIYNTNGIVSVNHLVNNNIGIKSFNRSNFQLIGNCSAQSSNETQEIKDNTSYEVYSCDQSLPYYFRYNVIRDDDNSGNSLGDPLLFNDNSWLPLYYKLDIQYNCWENNFDPLDDLYTNFGVFKYSPTWCPGKVFDGTIFPDEDMFLAADSLFANGNYTGAKLLFKSLIDQYPDSKYSEASMKNLFSLEKFEANNYSELKQYFLTNDSIIGDTLLSKVGQFLANRCDVELLNWSNAISWYEDIVQEPENESDSICAIIDLEDIYLMQENEGLKSTRNGCVSIFNRAAEKLYRNKRNSLLSLLPVAHKKSLISNFIEPQENSIVSQNFPNPISTHTEFYYQLRETQANVAVRITDIFGNTRETISGLEGSTGRHKVVIKELTLPNGVYQYSLVVNGKIIETKKMVVLK
jgi:hypothetical protein